MKKSANLESPTFGDLTETVKLLEGLSGAKREEPFTLYKTGAPGGKAHAFSATTQGSR